LFHIGEDEAKLNTWTEGALKSRESEHHRFVAPLSSHQPGGAGHARRLQFGAHGDRAVADAERVIVCCHDGKDLWLSGALYGLDRWWQ
jgi:hypothetical protein